MPTESDEERIHFVLTSGLPLAELAESFPTRLEAFRYYADYSAKRYGQPDGTTCALCARAGPVSECTYTWLASGEARKFHAPGIIGAPFAKNTAPQISPSWWMKFETRHAVCPSCVRRFAWRLRMTGFLSILLLLACYLLVVGLAFGLIMGVGILVGSGYHPRQDMVDLLTAMMLGVLAFIGCVLGFRYLRRLSIPPALRGIGRFPFALKEVRTGGLAINAAHLQY